MTKPLLAAVGSHSSPTAFLVSTFAPTPKAHLSVLRSVSKVAALVPEIAAGIQTAVAALGAAEQHQSTLQLVVDGGRWDERVLAGMRIPGRTISNSPWAFHTHYEIMLV